MRPARAFRTIWRINGVLMLLAFLLLGGLGIMGAVASMNSKRRSERAPPVAVAEKGERLFIGTAREVEGTPFVLLPLEARHSGMGLSSGKSYERETRNLLFYDSKTGAASWLRPEHTTEIVDYQLLRDSGAVQAKWDARSPAAPDPVRWIRYEIVPGGARTDSGTPREGVRQIAVTGPGGEGFTVVLDRLDEVLGYATARNATLVVFFRQEDGYFAAEIDLETRKVRRTLPLPKS